MTAGGLELTEPARVVPPQTFYTGKENYGDKRLLSGAGGVIQ